MNGITKTLKRRKIEKDLEKANQQTEYVHVLLGKCKRHQGPFLCVEELENCLSNIKDEKEQKRVLQEEILY